MSSKVDQLEKGLIRRLSRFVLPEPVSTLTDTARDSEIGMDYLGRDVTSGELKLDLPVPYETIFEIRDQPIKTSRTCKYPLVSARSYKTLLENSSSNKLIINEPSSPTSIQQLNVSPNVSQSRNVEIENNCIPCSAKLLRVSSSNSPRYPDSPDVVNKTSPRSRRARFSLLEPCTPRSSSSPSQNRNVLLAKKLLQNEQLEIQRIQASMTPEAYEAQQRELERNQLHMSARERHYDILYAGGQAIHEQKDTEELFAMYRNSIYENTV